MAEPIHTEKGIGEQMYEFLERNPENYDVTFSVGKEKKIVRAVKFILKAVSPAFEREFVNRWENAVVKEGEGIPLPEFDPTVFQLFIKLLMEDKWSVDHLKSLKLSGDDLLTLIELCRHFMITKAIPNLENVTSEFISTFHRYMDSHEFLLMSRLNLETLLSHEELPLGELEIYSAACRWAENKCKEDGIEPTGENMRNMLGGCLQKIRFPTMTSKDFAKVYRVKKLLTAEEIISVYEFIGLEEHEKNVYDTTQMPFGTKVRQNAGTQLDLTKVFPSVNIADGTCDGTIHENRFQSSKKILLKRIGFFGPTNKDSYYEITVQIKRAINNAYEEPFTTEKFERKLYAQKGKVFYFSFDHPITIEPSADDKWLNDYTLFYSVKGPSTSMFQGSGEKQTFRLAHNDFRFYSFSKNKHICELIFKEL